MNYLKKFKSYHEHPVLICQYMANLSLAIQNFSEDYIDNIHNILSTLRKNIPIKHIIYFRKPEGFIFNESRIPDYFLAGSDSRKSEQMAEYIKGLIELYCNLQNNVRRGTIILKGDDPIFVKNAPTLNKIKDIVECYLLTPVFVKNRIVSCLVFVIEKKEAEFFNDIKVETCIECFKEFEKCNMIPSLAAFMDIITPVFNTQESMVIAETKMDYRSRFEGLIVDLSTAFANCPNERVNTVIDDTISKLCQFSEFKYGFLYLINDDHTKLIRTNYWANGFTIREYVERSIDKNPWKWILENIKTKGMIKCRDCKIIPEIEKCGKDINSLIITPIICFSDEDDRVKGFMGISSDSDNLLIDSDDLLTKLKIIGSLLASGIKRRNLYNAKKEREQKLMIEMRDWRKQSLKRSQDLEVMKNQLVENRAILQSTCGGLCISPQ